MDVSGTLRAAAESVEVPRRRAIPIQADTNATYEQQSTEIAYQDGSWPDSHSMNPEPLAAEDRSHLADV